MLPLMISSISLLLLLQFFWLKNEYQNETENFRKQTHLIFRNTILEMSDSLLFKSIKPEQGDSLKIVMENMNGSRIVAKRFGFKRDTISNVQVFISSTGGKDSIERYLKPLISNIRGNRKARRFNIRLDHDSLNVKDIEEKLKVTLKEGHFDVIPFQVKAKGNLPFPPSRREMLKENIIYSPAGGYELNFSNLNYFILKKITPQILFSIFLTLLTTGSFIVLYRSLIMQKKMMALKNDFISNVTHELKTPVTTVGVALEALKNFKGLENKAMTEEYLEIAQKELGRLSMLTDKILKTAIFEDKGIIFTPERIEFDLLIEDVIASMKLLIAKGNAQIIFEKTGNNFEVTGSSEHLQSVIYNLLDNAIKYSPAIAKIIIHLKEEQRFVELSVKDNGIGIEKEYQKKIFEKFFRVPTGDVHNIKGYGLGLSYVDSVIKSHEGTLRVESEPGKGSCFTIRLKRSEESL